MFLTHLSEKNTALEFANSKNNNTRKRREESRREDERRNKEAEKTMSEQHFSL